MKNFRLFSVVASLMMMTATIAQNTNSIFGVDASVSIRQGNTGDLVIKYQFDQEDIYAAYEFYISLPEGITISTAEGDAISNIGFNTCSVVLQSDKSYKVMGANNPTKIIPGLTGTLLTLKLEADPLIEVGANLDEAEIKLVNLSTKTGENVEVAPTTFNISIVDYVTLKETSTELPVPAKDVEVRVIRTINANEWSTICLPFAISKSQMATAFGENVDVLLGDFNGCKTTLNDNDEVVSIQVNFEEKDEIEANHPYIIKVSSPVKTIIVDNVTIVEPNDLTVKRDKFRSFYNKFIGTYVANTKVDEFCLFLNDNKFWYSKGNTKMKAFRGYFEFYDILTEVEEANSNITLAFDETDGINNVTVGQPAEGIYDIQGRKVHTDENKPLKKGVYIINGKKVVK